MPIKNKTKTIGIVGGGQLGKMLATAAHKLGFKVIVLDPTPRCPASLEADKQIVGSYKEEDKILELAKQSDFITYELEGINANILEEIEKTGKPVHPSPKVLKVIKDKFAQKAFLLNHDIPLAKFALIQGQEDAEKQGEIFGYPYLLKARFDAFDGRGNFVIKEKADIPRGLEKLSTSALYAEKFVPFKKELAVVVARDKEGNIESFPVVETIHKNNICHVVRSPAPVSDEIKLKAEELAHKVLKTLQGVGVFAIEMFLTKDGEVLVNEIAPRVHNSGHLTIEAFSASQFEQQIRAITGMPLISPEQRSKYAVMVNILGDRDGRARLVRSKPKVTEDTYVHIYGKIQTRKERKMGHITVLGSNLKKTEEKALQTRKSIKI